MRYSNRGVSLRAIIGTRSRFLHTSDCDKESISKLHLGLTSDNLQGSLTLFPSADITRALYPPLLELLSKAVAVVVQVVFTRRHCLRGGGLARGLMVGWMRQRARGSVIMFYHFQGRAAVAPRELACPRTALVRCRSFDISCTQGHPTVPTSNQDHQTKTIDLYRRLFVYQYTNQKGSGR